MDSRDLIEGIIAENIEAMDHRISNSNPMKVYGKVTRIVGLTIEAVGINAPVGALCKIHQDKNTDIFAEVIGFAKEITFLMAYSSIEGIKPKALVSVVNEHVTIGVDDNLIGRMINGIGHPLDGRPSVNYSKYYPLHPKSINPLSRTRISSSLDVGVRAINGLLTICSGQRVGIFAESGIGKSVLLGMMTKFTEADVVVVGLIGERGREVKEFIEEVLGDRALNKCVIVASPADTSPLLKINAGLRAMAIAEYFRDQNKKVLLIVDSATRYANALREVALSCGELPTAHGFPPSVFSCVSEYVERAGNGAHSQGSITAIFTVLIEKDELTDPVGDHVKSVIDGHIVLSRKLADAGHYPAIDIEKSISRVMANVVSKDQFKAAVGFKKLYSLYQQNKDLLAVGMYQHGSDPDLDKAIQLWPVVQHYLQQSYDDMYNMEQSIHDLLQIVGASKESGNDK